MDYKYTVGEISRSATRALSVSQESFIPCGGMTCSVYTKYIYKSLVEPYSGAGLWGHISWREVQTVQNKARKLILGSSSNVSNWAIQGGMGRIEPSKDI